MIAQKRVDQPEYTGDKSILIYPSVPNYKSEDKKEAVKMVLGKLSLMKRSGIVKTLAREVKGGIVVPVGVQTLANNLREFENIALNVPNNLITVINADIDSYTDSYKIPPTYQISNISSDRIKGHHGVLVLGQAWHQNNEMLTDYIHEIHKAFNDQSGGDVKYSPAGAMIKNPAYMMHKVNKTGDTVNSIFDVGKLLGIYKSNIYNNKKVVDPDDYRFYHSVTQGEKSFYAYMIDFVKDDQQRNDRLHDFDTFRKNVDVYASYIQEMVNDNGTPLPDKKAEAIVERILFNAQRHNKKAELIHRPNQLKSSKSRVKNTEQKIREALFTISVTSRKFTTSNIASVSGLHRTTLSRHRKLINSLVEFHKGNR